MPHHHVRPALASLATKIPARSASVMMFAGICLLMTGRPDSGFDGPIRSPLLGTVAAMPLGSSMALMSRAIVFDFDGVIADTEPLHFAAFREVLPEVGIMLSRETYFSRYAGMSDAEILRRVLSDQDRSLSPEQVRQLLHNKDIAYRRQIEPGIDLATGAKALTQRAARRWALAICSGSKRVEIEHILRRADLLSVFSVIVTTEDVPGSKPDPAGYLLAIARLQGRLPELGPNDCLAIEDSAAGITAAKRAGMRTLQVCQGEPSGSGSAPDTVIQSLVELTDARLEALLV